MLFKKQRRLDFSRKEEIIQMRARLHDSIHQSEITDELIAEISRLNYRLGFDSTSVVMTLNFFEKVGHPWTSFAMAACAFTEDSFTRQIVRMLLLTKPSIWSQFEPKSDFDKLEGNVDFSHISNFKRTSSKFPEADINDYMLSKWLRGLDMDVTNLWFLRKFIPPLIFLRNK